MDVVLKNLVQDDLASFVHAEHLAAARALLAALQHAQVENDALVLVDTVAGATVSNLGGTWHALTAEIDVATTMTVVFDLTAMNGAMTATVWALGTDRLDAVSALAKLRSLPPLTAGALTNLGLFPPVAALVEELAVEHNDRVTMRVLGYPLVASIVPPPRCGTQWTLTVGYDGGGELRRGRPLRGDAPVTSDAATLLEITAMAIAALVSRNEAARLRAEPLTGDRLDTSSRDFSPLAVELQRAMWWMCHHEPPLQRGHVISSGRLKQGTGVRRDMAVAVLHAMRRAGLLADKGGERFVVAGATARGLTDQA